ncbi:MAG: hypothetical protein AVDCRST_MAG50-2738 [uncultured Acidimicrobiales bacterium]|uniref:Sec-independent protein translocase protein TatA n=1 Tax=uncultured Acidimicrobiales bacterium TaxID=310071 RepID=A0A6J4ITE9_9ACTN|nr:MAG: hypothetical protein AVDCRST_MAG50-2738 [uncultured Acidimicrobiales bacterium]
MPGPTELIIVLLVVLVLFGGSKLPKLARSLGQAKNEFEAGSREPAPELPSDSERDVSTRRTEH